MTDVQVLSLVIGLSSAFITAAGVLNSIILHGLSKRVTRLEEKFDGKQDKVACEDNIQRCGAVRKEWRREMKSDQEDIWNAFNHHSHEGLPAGAKVTRG